MSIAAATSFDLPESYSATEPPEARGLARDEVRLLVASPDDEIIDAHFRDLPNHLHAGDLLVVNTSATLPAAVDGIRVGHGPVVVHFATRLDDGMCVVELRTAPCAASPVLDAKPGEDVTLPSGVTLTLVGAYPDGGGGPGGGNRIWRASVDPLGGVSRLLTRDGRPIRYGYVPQQWPLASYQTVFATEPGSAEMPSAGRPFSAELVTRLVSKGVIVAPVVLHTGVSSQEAGEPPLPERYRVPRTTARLLEWTRRAGGRVIAVGTTVTRALESAARPNGSVAAAEGWTDLVLGPNQPARVIDGLITGLHAPDASHLQLLEAVVGPGLVRRAYQFALEHEYRWHEFGDACLFLPRR